MGWIGAWPAGWRGGIGVAVSALQKVGGATIATTMMMGLISVLLLCVTAPGEAGELREIAWRGRATGAASTTTTTTKATATGAGGAMELREPFGAARATVPAAPRRQEAKGMALREPFAPG
jgi:hypothetical protein